MQHVLAYTKSVASTTREGLDNIADGLISREGDTAYVVPGDFPEVGAAAVIGSTAASARLVSPSLDAANDLAEVFPVENGADSFDLTQPKLWKPMKSIPLEPGEELEFFAANTAAGADVIYGVVFLKQVGDLPPIPEGRILRVRATGTTTLNANQWTQVPLTLEERLPAGQYAVIGITPISATGIAARIVIPGSKNRPGAPCLAGTENDAKIHYGKEWMEFGGYNMGEFPHRDLPEVEFFASAADTAQTVFYDLVKIG